jgi:hypothetical protein
LPAVFSKKVFDRTPRRLQAQRLEADMIHKRLYVVKFEIEYPVLAVDAYDAESYIDDAIDDLSFLSDKAKAQPIAFSPSGAPVLPSGYTLKCLVYGADRDTMLAEAVAKEKEIRDLESKQMKLF